MSSEQPSPPDGRGVVGPGGREWWVQMARSLVVRAPLSVRRWWAQYWSSEPIWRRARGVGRARGGAGTCVRVGHCGSPVPPVGLRRLLLEAQAHVPPSMRHLSRPRHPAGLWSAHLLGLLGLLFVRRSHAGHLHAVESPDAEHHPRRFKCPRGTLKVQLLRQRP